MVRTDRRHAWLDTLCTATIPPRKPRHANPVVNDRQFSMDRDREIGSKAVRTKEAQQFRAKGPLAAQFEDCVQAIKRLFAALSANTSISEQIYIRTERCMSRLISWGHDSGASSRVLDHHLRRSSKPRTLTLRLLKELHENVLHGMYACSTTSYSLTNDVGSNRVSSLRSRQPRRANQSRPFRPFRPIVLVNTTR